MKDGSPKHLALKANRACIPQSHRIVANKEEFPKALRHLQWVFPLGLSSESRKKKIRVFSQEGFDCIHYKLLPKNLASN